MMFSKIGALAILTLCFFVEQSVQQECVAQSVVNLELTSSHLLIWNVRAGEPCKIDEFLVYIFHPGQPAEYAFTTVRNYVDVSFLEVCEEWTFVVVPISGHTTGAQRRAVGKLPLPTYADLTLTNLRFNHNAWTGHTHIHWDLNNTALGNCSLQYRVTVEEFGSPVIEDFYVDHNSLDLNFLSSCVTYQFGVRAINIAQPVIEGPLAGAVSYMPGRKQHPPVTAGGNTGPTWANLTFRLESQTRNPCALRFLYIEGDIPESINIDLGLHDRSQNVNVTITGLEPETYYTIEAYVDNIIGWSDPEKVSFLTEFNRTPELESTVTKIKK